MFLLCCFARSIQSVIGFVTLASFAGMLLIVSGTNARADDFNVVPSLGVRSEYNDNLFYTADKTADFKTTFIPGIEATNKTERLDSGLHAALKGIQFARNSQLDTVDYSFDGRLSYLCTPRMNLSATAEYDRDSSPSLEIGQFAFVSEVLRRYGQIYSVKDEYTLTQKNSIAMLYSYNQYDFVAVSMPSNSSGTQLPQSPPSPPNSGGNGGGGGNNNNNNNSSVTQTAILSSPDVKIHNPQLSLTHSFDELTKGNLVAAYTKYIYKYSTVDNYTVTIGLSRALNELWNVSVSGGGRFSQSEYTPVQRTFYGPILFSDSNLPQQKSAEWGWVGQCSIAYAGLYSNGSLSLVRDVSMGRLSATDSTVVSLNVSHRFTYDFEGNFTAGYQLNTSTFGEFASEATDDRILQFGVGGHYSFVKNSARDILLEVGYSKTIANYSSVSINQNYAYLNLIVKLPMF